MKLMEEQTPSSFASDHQRCQSSSVAAFAMVAPLLYVAKAPRFSCAVAGTSSAANGAIQRQARFMER